MQATLEQTYEPNAFSETLLSLSVSAAREGTHSITTRSCLESYATANFDEPGYRLGQLFEPGVLWEICYFERRDHGDALALRDPQSEATRALRWLFDDLRYATPRQRINLGLALCSIVRYGMASEVARSLAAESLNQRQRFDAAMLDFIITNRAEAGARSQQCFERMRAAIESGEVPAPSVADASAQAMVWYLKRRQLEPELMRWFVREGLEAVRSCPPGATRSSWYRAYAMLPANNRNHRATREVMTLARNEAEAAVSGSRRVYEQHAIKTYLESTLKECQLGGGDLELERKTGVQLLKLDPNWSPSYAEVAETYLRLGEYDQAATLLERAVALGAPYRLAHAYRLANCEQARGNLSRSVQLYREIAAIDPSNTSALVEGVRCGRTLGGDASKYFEEQLRATPHALNLQQRAVLAEVDHV